MAHQPLPFHRIVLQKFLLLFGSLFVIVGAIVYFWEYEYYVESSKNSLIQDVELLSLSITPKSDLDTLAKTVKQKLGIRVTIIAEDGEVVAESDKEKSQMENHRYREEILQSDKNDYGSIIRHSETIQKDMQYVAKKLNVGDKTLYIRVARELTGITQSIIDLAVKVLFALMLFFVAIFVMIYKINLQVTHEVEKIIRFLKSLTKKQKSTVIHSDYSKEFALITSLLTKVAQIIVKKEKRKTKYTDKLKKLNAQKDDIISAISHEFKNPIAVVNGYSQTLLEDPDINPNIRKKFLAKIHSNGKKLTRLIDTLRLSLKLDSNQKSLHIESVKLHELISESIETLKPNYPNREIILHGDTSLCVDVDRVMFGIVLSNLIENALKYSEDEVEVHFNAQKIEVIDTGIGIAKKDLQKITEKFYRVQQNRWNNSLGLGLFLVKNILKLHHFDLQITSQPHQGSTFCIIFKDF